MLTLDTFRKYTKKTSKDIIGYMHSTVVPSVRTSTRYCFGDFSVKDLYTNSKSPNHTKQMKKKLKLDFD